MRKVIILGAAGRDFHNFLVYFKDNPHYRVVCFTTTQITGIEKRIFPKELSGKLYPSGIPIHSESKLAELIKKHRADQVVFAYSDVSHEYVMHKASYVLSCGADFRLMGPQSTMIKSKKPIIAVTAVRTGSGKSQTTRNIALFLRSIGKKVAVIRHPMPYGDLRKQIWQRFVSYKDLDIHHTTIEEREEYEPLIDNGIIVYAGVDYEKILRKAEKEADIIIWDGGNNDIPFFKPDLHITLVDPHRPGHEISYYPGETNLQMADLIVINKIKTASKKNINIVKRNILGRNPKAQVLEAESTISVDNPNLIKNKKVLVIEDGPTLTHGGMNFGAGTIAARKYNAKIIDPRPYLSSSLKNTFETYPHLGKILPAMGYSAKQIKELENIIERTDCNTVVSGTPIDLRRVISVSKEISRVRYDLKLKNPNKWKKVLSNV